MYHNDQYLNDEQSETENYTEQSDNDILNIDPNIFNLEHFRDDKNQISNDIHEETHHAIIHVKPVPPSRTCST